MHLAPTRWSAVPVGVVDLASPVGVVDLASPVGVVDLAELYLQPLW